MKILPFTFNFSFSGNQIKNTPRFGNLAPLPYDTVSFGRKKSLPIKEQINSLSPDSFPSEGLREYVLSEINREGNEKTILDLQREYYSLLLDCETLDEAKEMFPEFENVLDANAIDLSQTGASRTFGKIAKGGIEGLTLENLSLNLLKLYFGELISVQREERYFKMPQSTTAKIMKILNIGMNKDYSKVIAAQRLVHTSSDNWQNPEYSKKISEATTAQWEDAEFRQKQTDARKEKWRRPSYRQNISEKRKQKWQEPEYRGQLTESRRLMWQNPEYRQKMIEIIKQRWQDPEYKKRHSVMMVQRWQDPEKRQQFSEFMTELWKDPVFAACMQIVARARSEAWSRHPEFSEIYSDVAKKFRGLNKIAKKREAGADLTKKEIAYEALYYKKCHETYPEIDSIIGKTQKEILEEWGFYDADASEYLDILSSLDASDN